MNRILADPSSGRFVSIRSPPSAFRYPGAMKHGSLPGDEVNVLLCEDPSSSLHAPLVHCYDRYKGTEIALVLLISTRMWAALKVVAHVILGECFMKKIGSVNLSVLRLPLGPSSVCLVLFSILFMFHEMVVKYPTQCNNN
jgi:hypothetical protein